MVSSFEPRSRTAATTAALFPPPPAPLARAVIEELFTTAEPGGGTRSSGPLSPTMAGPCGVESVPSANQLNKPPTSAPPAPPIAAPHHSGQR